MSRSVPKITIAGEIYSPNLGDGVIYQSLVYLYRKVHPAVEVIPLDISARQGWSSSSRQRLTAQLSQLGRQTLPHLYRWLNVLRVGLLYKQTWRKRWQAALIDTDALIVGGGQLLMDNDLDFPFKLRLLSGLAAERDIPIFLQAVGAGSRWSKTGKRWIRQLLRRASAISVRDEASRQNCLTLSGRDDIRLSADPALWADEVYGEQSSRSVGCIGVGLLNLVDFNAHRAGKEGVKPETYLTFWREVGMEFLRRGFRVEYFTNGNRLDEALAAILVAGDLLRKGVTVAQRPLYPRELAERVSSYQAIFAARLHANLLACVYGIPTVGLGWEPKIEQFYRAMGCEERVITFRQNACQEVADRLLSLGSGVPREKIAGYKALVLEDVAFVCQRIGWSS